MYNENNNENDDDAETSDESNKNQVQLPNPNEKGWTTVTRSGWFTKKPELFNPETGNVFTTVESNYYHLLEEMDEFKPTESATMAGSTIKQEIEKIGTYKPFNKFRPASKRRGKLRKRNKNPLMIY